jgi:hypothetical protein
MTEKERWKFTEGYFIGVISVFIILWIIENILLK